MPEPANYDPSMSCFKLNFSVSWLDDMNHQFFSDIDLLQTDPVTHSWQQPLANIDHSQCSQTTNDSQSDLLMIFTFQPSLYSLMSRILKTVKTKIKREKSKLDFKPEREPKAAETNRLATLQAVAVLGQATDVLRLLSLYRFARSA